MVKRKYRNDRPVFFCEECGFTYDNKNIAQKCEKWCSEHKSCNLEIAKQALNA